MTGIVSFYFISKIISFKNSLTTSFPGMYILIDVRFIHPGEEWRTIILLK